MARGHADASALIHQQKILLLHGKVGDDKEVKKRWSASYQPGGEQSSTLEIIEAMSKQERAEVRARVLR
jgi:hypothetical protein